MGYMPARDQLHTRGPDMAKHKHGEMDTTEQEKTFEGFVTFTVRTTIAIIVVLIFLALIGA
jgi:hypothetical protein